MTHFGSHYGLNAEYCLLRSLHVAVGNHYRTTLSSPSQPPSTSIQPPRVLFASQQAVRRRRRQRTSPTARLAQEVHQLRVCFMSFITHVSHAFDMTPADHSSTRTDTATQSDVRTMDSNIPNEHVLASMPPPATIRLPCPAETHEQQLDQTSPFADDDFLQNVTVTCFEDTDKPPSNHRRAVYEPVDYAFRRALSFGRQNHTPCWNRALAHTFRWSPGNRTTTTAAGRIHQSRCLRTVAGKARTFL